MQNPDNAHTDAQATEQTDAATLVATVPVRADGTVIASVPLGRGKSKSYTFVQREDIDGMPAVCEGIEPAHAQWLHSTGNFMTPREYAEEQEFLRRQAERAAKRGEVVAEPKRDTFVPGDDEAAELPVDPMAAPLETKAKPTGRVRKAS